MQLDYDFYELLFRLLDNEISDQDFARLTDRLNSDTSARRIYCQFMEDYSALSIRSATTIGEQVFLKDELLDDSFWELMSEEEGRAPGVEMCMPVQPQKPDIIRKVRRERVVRTINKTSLSVAIASLAALFLMVLYVRLSGPAPYEVATLSDSIDAKWLSELPVKSGTRLSAYTKPIQLVQGTVKLLTDDGVEIVLEAPTEFRFISYSEIALDYGKLFARVSEQGYGFSVATPNAKIVDLGTEFAVLCHIDGNTEVHMYKGRANLFAGQKSENKASELVAAGSARKVDRSDSNVQNVLLEENVVIRHIESRSGFLWRGEPLNLADIVGGGNGFGGGVTETGIDATTGTILSHLSNYATVTGPAGYQPVHGNSSIDGVFIPGIHEGQTVITSEGSYAVSFPKTMGNLWGYIFNGAFHQGFPSVRYPLQLDGIIFGTPDNPAITIHANQGITFDLSEIRKNVPGLAITAFRSLAGVSQTVQGALKKETEQNRSFDIFPEVKKVFDAQNSKVEFWVFVDGRQVFHKEISSIGGPEQVEIPITARDRFLTLATTESDDTIAYDWALFGRPELVLELAEK